MAGATRRKTRAKKFCSCIKQVRSYIKPRTGKGPAAKESAAIAICVKSMLQTKGRTLKKFKCRGKPFLITQKIQ